MYNNRAEIGVKSVIAICLVWGIMVLAMSCATGEAVSAERTLYGIRGQEIKKDTIQVRPGSLNYILLHPKRKGNE